MHWGRNCPDGFAFSPETGLYLADRTYLEPDFIVFSCVKPKAHVKGPDVLLAVEVADSSLGYDLGRKPSIYAAHGVRELWVIDAPRRITHVHRGVKDGGYMAIDIKTAADRVTPVVAPAAFAFALDDLPEI